MTNEESFMMKVVGTVLLLLTAFDAFARMPIPFKCPEIDPASAFAGLTLFVGALAVLRGRKHGQ
jgi:hypothetical protein